MLAVHAHGAFLRRGGGPTPKRRIKKLPKVIWSGSSTEKGEKMTANEVIKALNLKPHPGEGGYYRETYRSEKVDAPATVFGIDSVNPRVISTAIYYLIVPNSFSALHRIKSDEVFHFYGGDPVEMIQIDERGKLTRFTLGPEILKGQTPQVVVRRGMWQGLRLLNGGEWALMGTTVSPGFEFEDFELGNRDKLTKIYPQHCNEILRFTHGGDETSE